MAIKKLKQMKAVITQSGSEETIKKINEIVKVTNFIEKRTAVLFKKAQKIEEWINKLMEE